MDLAAQVKRLGHEVIGPVHKIKAATEIASGADEIDFALLDVNLRGEQSTGVAKILRERGVPFAFLTGYESPAIEEEFTDARILPKPLSQGALESLIASNTPA